jgi:hypothetical protein
LLYTGVVASVIKLELAELSVVIVVGDWDPKVYCLDPSVEHKVEESEVVVNLVSTVAEGFFTHCYKKDKGGSIWSSYSLESLFRHLMNSC